MRSSPVTYSSGKRSAFSLFALDIFSTNEAYNKRQQRQIVLSYHPTSLARVDRTTNSSSDADASIPPDIPTFTQALTRSIPRGALIRASSSPKAGYNRKSQA